MSGELQGLLPCFAVGGDATHASRPRPHAVAGIQYVSQVRHFRNNLRSFVVVVNLPPQMRRAPEFGASVHRWPKTPEPESLCDKARLQLQKHQPKSADHGFGQSLRPSHSRLSHHIQELRNLSSEIEHVSV